MELSIVTPAGKVFEGEVSGIVAPGVMGSFGVLPGHAPIISALEHGVVKLTAGGSEKLYAIDGGFLEVRGPNVVILAGRVETATDLEDARAKAKHLAPPRAAQT